MKKREIKNNCLENLEEKELKEIMRAAKELRANNYLAFLNVKNVMHYMVEGTKKKENSNKKSQCTK
ncbi:hypothetical protein ACQR2V_06260 [Clostridium perfringens]